MLTLKILGAIGTLAFGVWLGLSSGYRRDLDRIDEAMENPRRRWRATRHFTFLNAFMNRKAPPSARRRHRGRTPFSG